MEIERSPSVRLAPLKFICVRLRSSAVSLPSLGASRRLLRDQWLRRGLRVGQVEGKKQPRASGFGVGGIGGVDAAEEVAGFELLAGFGEAVEADGGVEDRL